VLQHTLVVVEVEQDILVIQLLLNQEDLVVLQELVVVKQDQILELTQVQLVLTLVVEVVVFKVVLDVMLVELVVRVSLLQEHLQLQEFTLQHAVHVHQLHLLMVQLKLQK
jgi:hypothetical protein